MVKIVTEVERKKNRYNRKCNEKNYRRVEKSERSSLLQYSQLFTTILANIKWNGKEFAFIELKKKTPERLCCIFLNEMGEVS